VNRQKIPWLQLILAGVCGILRRVQDNTKANGDLRIKSILPSSAATWIEDTIAFF
jgi:hypothetical protein